MAETVQISHLRRTLRRTFGFRSLREGQEEVIRSIVEGKDTLAIMPTGAGKSLCYQLPGAQLPGTTVVVSPLLSLMKDQVDKLQELGIGAAQVNSTLTSREETEVLEAIGKEQHEFVFVTPERLSQSGFLDTLKTNRIDVFVIDEAHCISQWGHDFRPSYLRLREAIEVLGNPPVLALTATATPEVVDDILRQLGREDMQVLSTGVFRDNLHLEVIRVAGEQAKLHQLARLLAEIEGTGIVYTSTVKDCETVTGHLQGLGFDVARYHGRLSGKERHRNQDRFMAGELKAVVATNAFGMGIDKPDIRFVIHYSMPGTLEAYYQEAGRAGRDGQPARCILLFQPEDRNTHIFFLNGKYPKQEHFRTVYRALERLKADRHPVTVAEIHERARDVAQNKVRVVLPAMKDLGLLEEPEAGSFRLLRSGLEPEELEELGRQYEQRAEADRDRLRRVMLYAQTALCRWKAILDYFGESAAVDWNNRGDKCGVCDNCGRPIAEPVVAHDRLAILPPRSKPEVLPLSSILGEKDPSTLRRGDTLTLPMFGTGEVREVGEENLTVAFSDGEVREFRR
ncbi:MAG: RecQ family ATP-dependent DNA helicase [Thermoanaerobaculia bacterium]